MTPPEVASSDRFGKFVLAGKLGAGGMGEVWKAWDNELARWVAIKFLHGRDDEEVARFRREAQLAAKLAHSNVAAIYEVGVLDGRYFIAMQYIEGRTLRGLRPGARESVRLVRDAARAVAHAHERGIVHRDIKPDNVMVDPRGHVTVMDFGLARSVEGPSNLSRSGVLVGTPAYMAPEQARGERVDARVDVYALGATLYELLTGQAPFPPGEDILELLTRVTVDEPKPPRTVDSKIAKDLDTIVVKCLEKDRGRRYATAGALADDLERFLEGEAIVARPASLMYRLHKRLSKRKAQAAAVAGAAATVLVCAILLPRLLAARGEAAVAGARLREVQLYLPLESELAVLRHKFNQPDFQLTDEMFARYERLVERVRTQMRETGASAQGQYLIGRCYEVLGDDARALQAYDRALGHDPDHPSSLLARGRLLIERTLRTSESEGTSDAERRRLGAGARDAVAQIRRGAAASAGRASLDLDLAEAYLAVIENGRYPCGDALRRWKSEPSAEEFLLVEALMGGDMERRATEALRLAPSSFKAYFWRGVVRNMRGKVAAALEDFTRAIDINPRFAWAYVQRGVTREAHGDAGALADYEQALRIQPGLAVAYMNRGAWKEVHGDVPGGLADYDRAIGLDPDDPNAYSNRGSAKLMQRDFAGALTDANRAIQLRPEAGAYNIRGLVRHAQGDREGALADFDRALEIQPRHAKALANRGVVRRERGDLVGALEDLDGAIRLEPGYADTYWNRARARQDKGDLAAALADYDRAIELRPDYVEAYCNRGNVKRARHDLAGARADYDRAIQMRPDLAEAYCNRGTVRHVQGDPQGAVADLDRAVQLRPDYADAYYNRGYVRQQEGDASGAIADYDRVIELKPDYANAYYHRAELKFARQDFAGAVADDDRFIRLEPGAADGHFNRGNAKRMQGDLDGAIADFGRAIELRPDFAAAYCNRGAARLQQRDPARAIPDFDEALRLTPTFPDALVNRGSARELLGEYARAIEDYEAALRSAPSDWPYRHAVEATVHRARSKLPRP